MSIVSNRELLRRLPVFAALTDSQVDNISSSLIKQRFRRGSLIIQKGRKNDYFYVLLNGTAEASIINDDGREVILFDLQVGDYIGESCLLDGGPSEFSVRTKTQSDVLLLNKQLFIECVSHNPIFVKSLLLKAVWSLRRANDKIEVIALHPVHVRVHKELIKMSRVDSKDRHVIHGRVSRQLIARKVGASREMVSRVLKDFEQKDMIKTVRDEKCVYLTEMFFRGFID